MDIIHPYFNSELFNFKNIIYIYTQTTSMFNFQILNFLNLFIGSIVKIWILRFSTYRILIITSM